MTKKIKEKLYISMNKILIIVISFLTFNALAADSTLWTKIHEESDITIYSQRADDAVLPFKATGIVNKNIDQILENLMDYKNKSKWAPKLKNVKLHKQLTDNEFIFSEYYSTPWPATDREFLLKGTINRINKNKITLKAKSIVDGDFSNADHIQADVKYINIILNKISKNKTQIQFEFHGDMKGWMPVWLMNLIQKKWPLRFIQGLQKYNHLSSL
jgi:hypothetical protein